MCFKILGNSGMSDWQILKSTEKASFFFSSFSVGIFMEQEKSFLKNYFKRFIFETKTEGD